MSYRRQLLHHLMDMGSLLGTILGSILNYQRGPPMSTAKGPLIRLILTVAHMSRVFFVVEPSKIIFLI